ncbi:MAG: YqgE/AlgH family protein [Burkholderiales bacterium]|nr:YqgE/AlgH family protein [Burkholderiales bacterium]
MSGDSAPINLTNHFLIAMPGLEDAIFSKSVVYVCEHTPRGALGLVINKPADIKMAALFGKVDLPLKRQDLTDKPEQALYASTMSIPGGLEMTTSKDVLEALSTGYGPRRVLVTLGYSAWGEGQLETELSENSWLTVDADQSVIFDTPVEQRYDRALSLLGLQSWMISSQVGHA